MLLHDSFFFHTIKLLRSQVNAFRPGLSFHLITLQKIDHATIQLTEKKIVCDASDDTAFNRNLHFLVNPTKLHHSTIYFLQFSSN